MRRSIFGLASAILSLSLCFASRRVTRRLQIVMITILVNYSWMLSLRVFKSRNSASVAITSVYTVSIKRNTMPLGGLTFTIANGCNALAYGPKMQEVNNHLSCKAFMWAHRLGDSLGRVSARSLVHSIAHTLKYLLPVPAGFLGLELEV